MKIEKVHALYFSPTGTTAAITTYLAKSIAALLPEVSLEILDFTLPPAREKVPDIRQGEVAVVGFPVYAGRLPNLLLKYLAAWKSNGALVVPLVVYGNRSYGNALVELSDILVNAGFLSIAGAAFVGQHSFSAKLATGRPDREDMELAGRFAADIADRITGIEQGVFSKVEIPGEGAPDYGGYYKPKGVGGEVVNFLKAKPVTTDVCMGCRHCAEVCPMGAIDFEHPSEVPGICIKCNACIKQCPVNAKHLNDEAYLSHVRFLETVYTSRAKVELF